MEVWDRMPVEVGLDSLDLTDKKKSEECLDLVEILVDNWERCWRDTFE